MKTPLKGIDTCQSRMHENAMDKSAECHVVFSFVFSIPLCAWDAWEWKKKCGPPSGRYQIVQLPFCFIRYRPKGKSGFVVIQSFRISRKENIFWSQLPDFGPPNFLNWDYPISKISLHSCGRSLSDFLFPLPYCPRSHARRYLRLCLRRQEIPDLLKVV